MHTPGPWVLADDQRFGYLICDSGAGTDQRPIAFVSSLEFNCNETRDNALAIVAAPEALEACRLFSKACDEGVWAEFVAAIDKAREALRKAGML